MDLAGRWRRISTSTSSGSDGAVTISCGGAIAKLLLCAVAVLICGARGTGSVSLIRGPRTLVTRRSPWTFSAGRRVLLYLVLPFFGRELCPILYLYPVYMSRRNGLGLCFVDRVGMVLDSFPICNLLRISFLRTNLHACEIPNNNVNIHC
jgi:hypothetical protein